MTPEKKELNEAVNAFDQLNRVKQMNIFERMMFVSMELATVAKNLEVSAGNAGKYKAVGEADVLRAVKPLEAKYRVYSYPIEREIIDNGILESKDFKGNIRKQFYERIRITYRFVNIDKPDEFVEIPSYGDGIDSGDKSVGKAMTYADKYALMKAYKIVTGEDPDQEASEDLTSFERNPKRNGYAPASHGNAPVSAKQGSVGNFPTDDENERDSLLLKASGMGIDLSRLAQYLRKPIQELSNLDLKNAIAQKEAVAKKAKPQTEGE